MKEVLIGIVVSIVIIYIQMFLSHFFREIGHTIFYKTLFKDKINKIRIGFGKPLIKTKTMEINKIPLSSKTYYGDKMESGTWRSVFTYVGGALGIVFNIILLIPLIYLVNRRADLHLVIHMGISPIVIRIMAYYNLFLILNTFFAFKMPDLPPDGYTSDGWFFQDDIQKIFNENAEVGNDN